MAGSFRMFDRQELKERSRNRRIEERISQQRQEKEREHGLSLHAHRATLSTLEFPVLTCLEPEVSPWTNPTGRLHSDTNHVNSIIEKIVTLTNSSEIEKANFSGVMIYPHLIIYIFLHLKHCTIDQSPLHEFKKILLEWHAWDSIDMMEKHQLIRDYLMDLYKKALQRHPDLHSENILAKLLTLDDIALCARLAVSVTNKNEYRQILDRRGPAAQALLNLLQAGLNFPMDSAYKHGHLNALIKLSRASGLYPECIVLKTIKIDPNPVTHGGFADIYKGDLLGQKIGIKQLRVYERSDIDKLFREFSTEAVTWRQLSHPNVLPFYGVFHPDTNMPRLCLVSPWMTMGNVVQFLASISNIDCVPLCLDVADGLAYLHKENIIHGDLKGFNILVSQSHRAFIADFGVATTIHSAATLTFKTTTHRAGTLRWQAPELWPSMNDASSADTERHNTQASDVYAFALVCYEMFSGTFPFIDIPHDYHVILAIQSGKRPLRPSDERSQIRGLTNEVWHIIEACWVQEPSQRPTASRIADQLRSLPNQPMDERPFDDFSISPSSQVLQRQLNLPFSTLTTSIVN